MRRIRRPVATRAGRFDESGAERERRMAREVRDRDDLVAKRRDQQQIDALKDARHLLRDLAAEPVGLHEVDRGEKARLPEHVRPSVRGLHLQLIEPAGSIQRRDGRVRWTEGGLSVLWSEARTAAQR